jgi:ribose transport system permease protein
MASSNNRKRSISENFIDFLVSREVLIGGVITIIMIIMGFVSPYFLRMPNIRGLLIGTTMDGIIAIGMVMVLASGELDLSVGSTLAFAGIVAGLALNNGIPMIFCVILALGAAGLVGLVNGICVSKLKFDSFITTLATMIMVRGFLLVISNGRAIVTLPDNYTQLGQKTILGFQFPVYVFFALAILFGWIFRNIRIFRLSYYVGSNEDAAKMSGINVDLVKTLSFIIVAVMAGISGVLMSARMGMSSVTIGQQTNLNVLAACVIGGSSFKGGRGTVLGAVLGALLLQVLTNALNIAGIGIYWQQVFTGGVLLGAIALDKFKKQ